MRQRGSDLVSGRESEICLAPSRTLVLALSISMTIRRDQFHSENLHAQSTPPLHSHHTTAITQPNPQTAGTIELVSFDSPPSVTDRLTRKLGFLSPAETNTSPPVRRPEVAARREVSRASEKGRMKAKNKKNQKRRIEGRKERATRSFHK
jgi:hypothetical protein